MPLDCHSGSGGEQEEVVVRLVRMNGLHELEDPGEPIGVLARDLREPLAEVLVLGGARRQPHCAGDHVVGRVDLLVDQVGGDDGLEPRPEDPVTSGASG